MQGIQSETMAPLIQNVRLAAAQNLLSVNGFNGAVCQDPANNPIPSLDEARAAVERAIPQESKKLSYIEIFNQNVEKFYKAEIMREETKRKAEQPGNSMPFEEICIEGLALRKSIAFAKARLDGATDSLDGAADITDLKRLIVPIISNMEPNRLPSLLSSGYPLNPKILRFLISIALPALLRHTLALTIFLLNRCRRLIWEKVYQAVTKKLPTMHTQRIAAALKKTPISEATSVSSALGRTGRNFALDISPVSYLNGLKIIVSRLTKLHFKTWGLLWEKSCLVTRLLCYLKPLSEAIGLVYAAKQRIEDTSALNKKLLREKVSIFSGSEEIGRTVEGNKIQRELERSLYTAEHGALPPDHLRTLEISTPLTSQTKINTVWDLFHYTIMKPDLPPIPSRVVVPTVLSKVFYPDVMGTQGKFVAVRFELDGNQKLSPVTERRHTRNEPESSVAQCVGTALFYKLWPIAGGLSLREIPGYIGNQANEIKEGTRTQIQRITDGVTATQNAALRLTQ